MADGRWIIPDNASVPETDSSAPSRGGRMLSLGDVCRELGVSYATGRNWLKLGKLVPSTVRGRTPEFDAAYVSMLKAALKDGSSKTLKSRRNKHFISGSGLYGSYIDSSCAGTGSVTATLGCIEDSGMDVTDDLIRVIIADAAVQMLYSSRDRTMHLEQFLLHRNEGVLPCASLIDDLLGDACAPEYIAGCPALFEVPYAADGCNDILGLLYISCLNAGRRKATGSYYTPASVADILIGNLCVEDLGDARILDPCCGTGNFLLRLPDNVKLENIYGNDLDAMSVMVARLNLALKYNVQTPEILYRNITVSDYLTAYAGPSVDCIIGNPPWGYAFSADEADALNGLYMTARGSRTESYDVFIEKSLKSLSGGGIMSFIVPEAVLNVKSHHEIRQIILDTAEIQYVNYLGNVFDGVQCPCVILRLRRKPCGSAAENGGHVCSGTAVVQNGETFTCGERQMTADCFSFTMNDTEYSILRKAANLPGACFLKDNAVFALGIVTGNNKGYVSSVKTDSNEMILKGSDLLKFRYIHSQNYIDFNPAAFQQVAPEAYYRAPEKLLYRFISSQLVFAYDDRGTLSLNSCNILIPEIKGLSCKYVMAVLDSRVAQFWFSKQYNSIKVLRSHIEQIPIPFADEATQGRIEALVDRIRFSDRAGEICSAYDSLDAIIAGLYGLEAGEYETVRASTGKDNSFLL